MTARRRPRLIAINLMFLQAACSEPPPPAAELGSEPFQPVTRVFRCGEPAGAVTLVTRTRPGGLSLFVPPALGEPHRLLAEVTPGERYAADGTELIIHDNAADLITPDAQLRACAFDPAASIWEHAKLGGADFRGLGNEPGWVLEVRRQSELWFSYDYGQSEVTVPIVATASDAAAGSTTYTGRSDALALTVTLTGARCADTMADEVYPTRVEVTLDGHTYTGCGRPLH